MLLLGIVEARQGRLEEALAIYDRLLERQADATVARLNRAEVLRSLGRLDEAEGDYRRILQHQPNQREAEAGLLELRREKQKRSGSQVGGD
jgi:tetratricopeptide (TPR) repeat protein